MPGRVLVTGIHGFTARYVRLALEQRGHEVIGFGRRAARQPGELKVDLLDRSQVRAHLKDLRPTHVIHLAAIAFVAHEDIGEMYRVNLIGSLNLLEALDGLALEKVILASSANVYGRPQRNPVDESAVPAPISHYGVTKYALELMAGRWFDRLPVLLVRPFNYTGVGQDQRFVLAKLVAHFRERKPLLELGETSVVREFMDVRDVADIYVRLLESGARSESVNICSGAGHRLDAVLCKLEEMTSFSPQLRRSEALVRGNEIPELVGSDRRLKHLCPGATFRTLEETLHWMLEAKSGAAIS